MNNRLLRAAALAAALLPLLAEAAPLAFETALTMAVQRSEAARASRAGLQSTTEAARAAGQLPDPTLSVGIDNLPVTGPDRFGTARDSMTMKRVGFSQEWMSLEKRAARRRFDRIFRSALRSGADGVPSARPRDASENEIQGEVHS